MKNKKILTPLLCTVLAFGILGAGCSKGTDPLTFPEQPALHQNDSSVSTGAAAELGSLKSFTAQTLNGGSFTQDDITARDVTVINFWSLMCGPCIDEMPDLAAFSKALPDNVQMVTVCLDGMGDEAYVESILSETGYEGVTLLSGDGDFQGVCDHIQYTPTTVIVDAEGNLVGDAVIGSQEDFSGTFLTAVNAALKTSGKAEITLET